ncbi:hypothetical protein KPL74_05445 [Bacillus sp. NP157]|nr:hypothetical protein KPL74_05445 [Bacillus sp. NP157]
MARTTLYLPFNAAPRGQWIVRRNYDLVGQFPTQDEALRHAHALLTVIRAQPGQDAEIKVEDERGLWRLEAEVAS